VLLRLAGFRDAVALRAAADQTPGTEADRVQALAARLKKAWVEELPTQARAAEKDGRWAELDRIARATPPGVTPYRDPPTPPGAPPVKLLEAHDRAYRKFARDQLTADKSARGRTPEAGLFYNEAVNLAPRD
jgi:hypothetical protein